MQSVWLRRGLLGLAVGVLGVQFVIAVVHPEGDFLLHQRFAQQLWAGRFLYDVSDNPYPPAFALAYAPLAYLSPHLAKPLFFLVGLTALLSLLWMLNDFTRRSLPLARGKLFWVWAATLFIASRFITRDFDDGGQNLILLALAWAGVWLFLRGRALSAGVSLGLAIALKCTAGILLAYFLLKRQWKMAAGTAAWTVLFSVAPVLWMGWGSYVRHMQAWTDCVVTGVTQPDPSVGVLGPEPLQNRALRPTLARYLMTLPPGHAGRFDSPAYVDFFNLSPAHASLVVKVVMLLGAGFVAWRFRRPLAAGEPLAPVWEVGILCVLGLLYSPITWTQHCVAALPVLFLLVRSYAAGRIASRWVVAGMAAFALIVLGTNRSFIGMNGAYLMDSYHVVTFALIGLVGLALVFGGAGTGAALAGKDTEADDGAATGNGLEPHRSPADGRAA